MEQASFSGTIVQNALVTLPIEVLVYIFSFLSTRDKVRIRCISKTLRSVSEIPSLWEEFIWSRYVPRDEKLLKHILKKFGKYIKRIHFADHIAPSKLEVMLKYCKNVTHLSLPSFHYITRHGSIEKLVSIVQTMGCIQILRILVTDGDALIRQYFRLSNALKELSLHYRLATMRLCETMQQWLEEWANVNYTPRKLNIIVDRKLLMLRTLVSSLQSCVPILRNKTLQDSEGIAWVNIYLDISPTIPFVQLRVTNSSVVLSSVKASKYGILGLDDDTLHLTEGSYRGKKVYKALLTGISNEYIDTSVANLASVTYFDASACRVLYPGHLEQLSLACPNLQRLDLRGNSNCLNNLEGLHSLANNCKSLHGLCLKDIHVHDTCEYECIQLWEILCMMRLTQLAIETCIINVCDSRNAISVATAAGDCSARVKRQKLNHMFQRYSSLQVLEVTQNRRFYYHMQSCYNPSDNELLLLTNFPSITYYRLCSLPSNNCYHTLKQIFAQKYLRCLFLSKTISGKLSLSLEGHCSSLQQLYIHSKDTVPTEAFIDTLCGHGGLEHVIVCFKSLTAKSIVNMIEHSSNLVTFRVYLYSRAFLKSHLKQLTTTLKTKFSKRKLFNGGNFDIKVSYHSSRIEVNGDTDLSSVWDSFVDTEFM